MEIHLHLAAAYETDPRVEHFEWLEPMFNERLEIRAVRRADLQLRTAAG